MLNRIKQACGGAIGRLSRRIGAVSRAQWGRAAYYAGLALLLALLGAASHAYRAKLSQPVEPPPAREALSAQAEPLLPTPEPTPEPVVWAWPLEGEIVGEYAPDAPVWSGTLMQWQTHPALDIAGSPGEAVYACRDGVVADAYHDRLWGNVIVLEHGDGYRSTYCGLNTLNLVEVGQSVAVGDVLSAVAPSVPCEADLPAHIHFELTQAGETADFQALLG